MQDKKKFKQKAAPSRPEMDFELQRNRKKVKSPKYNNAKYWLSQDEGEEDDDDYDINAIFGKDEEE